MKSSSVNVVRQGHGAHQRGFFDAGIGLALLALFSVASAVIVSSESNRNEQQLASCASAFAGDTQPQAGCEQVR